MTELYDPAMPKRYSESLLGILQSQSVLDIDVVMAARGIDARRLDCGGTLTATEFDVLLSAAAELLARTDIGFTLGECVDRTSLDALSVALQTCTTVDAALRMIARHSRMVMPLAIVEYRRDREFGHYIFRPGMAMSRTTMYALEEAFTVTVHRDWVALCGSSKGVEFWLSMPRPPHVGRYRELAPTRIHFGATALPEVRCRLPARMLDLPFHCIAPREAEAADLSRPAGQLPPWFRCGEWISLMLQEAEGVQPSLCELAALLCVSERTLSRRLANDGLSLRSVGCAVRGERARTLLRESPQSIKQIAWRLGYGSMTAFGAAFRNEHGVSPSEYRRLSRNEAAPE